MPAPVGACACASSLCPRSHCSLLPLPALRFPNTGDLVTGRISREELAAVAAAAVGTPASAQKTFELRRQEAADAAGKAMSEQDTLR